MEERNLIHHERTSDPALVDLVGPLAWRIIDKSWLEREVRPLSQGGCWPPQSCVRKFLLPVLQVEMVQLVGADQVHWRTNSGNLLPNMIGQLYR